MSATNQNLFLNVNFKLVIKKLPNVEFFCTSVTYPPLKVDPIPINTPMGTVFQPADNLNYGVLEIHFLLDEDLNNYFEIVTWMKAIGIPFAQRSKDLYVGGKYNPFSDMTMIIMDNNGTPTRQIAFVDAFPIDLGGVTYDSGAESPSTPKCLATFQFNWYEILGENDYI
jgi:hypothetical protein